MKKKTVFTFFILVVIFIPMNVEAKQKTIQGIYTNIEYTSECFPDYEDISIKFYIKRSEALDLPKNESLYMIGYRIVLNNTLLAYINYKGDIDKYIPEMEKIELSYDKEDLELNETDYAAYHKLTIQISAISIDPENVERKIADDYITTEIYFDREATTQEILQIMRVTLVPMMVVFVILLIKRKLNKNNLENITFLNMPKYLFRRIGGR
ncbi:MAG: hypothetical protein ACTSSG_07295 [Candidatus Heimdallarchaeaceae archaeon]